MKLDDLKARGAFVSAEPVPKEIEWTHEGEDGEVTDKFTVHIRLLAYGVIERIIQIDPENPERSINAALISKAVLLGEPDAFETIDYEMAYQLEPSLANKLVKAINEVNRKAPDPKNSAPSMKSGTNSSSTASAVEPSTKQSKT